MTRKTAILVFVQDISLDIKKKQLTPSKNKGINELIFEHLNHNVKRLVHTLIFPTFYSNELISPQNNSFGNRLSLAIQAVFEKGYEKVICVGNDCPALNKSQILEAARKLDSVDTVLGPDKRGGVYLLGISKNTFNANVFENLAWETNLMLESYLSTYRNQEIDILDTIADIHTLQDLQSYTSSTYLIKFLLQIISKLYLIVPTYQLNFSPTQLVRFSLLRAPPLS